MCFHEEAKYPSHGSPRQIDVLVDDAVIRFGDGDGFVEKDVRIEEAFSCLIRCLLCQSISGDALIFKF